MGQCRYCGEPTGFLQRSHRACRKSRAEGIAAIAGVVADEALAAGEAAKRIKALGERHRVRDKDLVRAVRNGWAACVKGHLRRDGVSRAEERRLDAVLIHFGTDRAEADRLWLWRRVERTRRDAAERRIRRLLRAAMAAPADPGRGEKNASGRALARLEDDVAAAATEGGLPEPEMRAILVAAVGAEVDRMLDDNFLSAEEEHAFAAITSRFNISEADLRGAWTRIVQAGLLRDLMEGKIPERMNFTGHPFRLQKSETLIWVFQNVGYSTVRTRTEFRGGHAGVSVRVARGLYFRTGGFKGRPVRREEAVRVDTGLLGVTTRHLYFAGSRRSFRVRHDRIVTLVPYSDGVGIMRDGVRAKPETFEVGDGWFVYNLLRNIEVP